MWPCLTRFMRSDHERMTPRMIPWIPFLIVCFIAVVSPAADNAPPHFKSLAEATQALDRALAAPDPGAALLALLPSEGNYLSEHPQVIVMLQEARERTGPFAKLYADRQFPETATTYKLGGHASELGHVHIDFIREEEVWRLKRIWNCR